MLNGHPLYNSQGAINRHPDRRVLECILFFGVFVLYCCTDCVDSRSVFYTPKDHVLHSESCCLEVDGIAPVCRGGEKVIQRIIACTSLMV